MNRFIASFTVAEQRIIVFVLVALGIGCGVLQWRESRQSRLTFDLAEVNRQMPRMPKPVLPPGMNSAGLVDVNLAEAAVLETLPGIGPAMAAAILRQRESAGPFGSMDDLDKVPGIGPAMMARLAPMVTFGDAAGAKAKGATTGRSGADTSLLTNAAPAPMPLTIGDAAAQGALSPNAININTASAEELDKLIGVGPALAHRIIKDRYENGPFNTVKELDRVRGIGPSILSKNEGMIRVK